MMLSKMSGNIAVSTLNVQCKYVQCKPICGTSDVSNSFLLLSFIVEVNATIAIPVQRALNDS